MSEKFGFFVSKYREQWGVGLPHSCDEWMITINSHKEAVVELTNFISEAQAALAALVREEEIHAD